MLTAITTIDADAGMAILERTPPQRQRQAFEDAQTAGAESRSPPKDSFVFPSLEDMAAPVRERNAWQQPAAATASASETVSPAIPQPPKQQSPLKLAHSSAQHAKQGSPDRASSFSPNMTRKRATPGGEGSLKKSPSKALASATDEAFEAQMERAIALGENPFMDRRRAAMRDDSNTSASSSMMATSPQRQATQLNRPRPRPSTAARVSVSRSTDLQSHQAQPIYPTLPRASTSTIIDLSSQRDEGTFSPAAPTMHQEVPNRTTQDVQRAAAVVRRSLLSNTEHTKPAEAQPPPPPPPVHSPPRHRSPPIEVFTPQRKTLSSNPQIVPFAQQEELHKMRVELQDCKARLRQAQLDVERQERIAQTLQDEQAQATETWSAAVMREKRQLMSMETALKASEYAAARHAWKQRMVADEEVRRARIEVVIAKNEVTCLAVQQREAEHSSVETSQLRKEMVTLQEEVVRVRDERKQTMQRAKQSEQALADMHEQVEALQADVARETARRKQVAHREATLRGEVEELQDVASREAALRRDLAELKSALRAEKGKVAELRAAKTTAAKPTVIASSPLSPQPPKKVKSAAATSSKAAASSSAQKTSRVPARSEEDYSREYDNRPSSPHASRSKTAKPPQRPHEDTPQHVDDEREGEPIAPPTRSRPQPRPTVKKAAAAPAAKRTSDDMDAEDAPAVSHKKPSTKASSGKVKKAAVVEQAPPPAPPLVEEDEEVEYVDNFEAEASPPPEVPKRRGVKTGEATAAMDVPSFVPAAKKTSTLLAKARDATKKATDGTAVPRRREPSEGAAGFDEQGKANGRTRKTTAAAAKPVPAFDETMKTPLLPSRRTLVLNGGDDDGDDDDDDAHADMSVTVGVQKAKKSAASAKLASNDVDEGAAATPFVATEPKKKRRKLLKQGSNPAGEFITWRGDAEGGLNPQLNLPMELSPLKPGDAGGNGHERLGGVRSAMAGAHMFGGGGRR